MIMKTRLFPLFALCGIFAGSGLMAQTTDTPSTQASFTATATVTGAPRFSGRINEVVALAQSGIDQSIVVSYIKTSPGPFQPSADEIIKLRDLGVSSEIITTMMQRGAEVRDQNRAIAASAPAQSQTYAQSSVSYAQPAPAQSWPPPYVDPTYYPTYYSEPSSVVYVGGSYGYPYYYNNYCYPSYYSRVGFYGPRFSVNFGAPFGGFRVGGFNGGFHGGPIGGGFHGGGGGGGFHGGIGVGMHGGHR